MTEPLTPNVETNRILSSCGRTANVKLPMMFPANRPPLSGQISARIFRLGRSVMTSARGGAQPWRLVFERRTPPFIDALMGYTGGEDTRTQVELDFPTLEAAIAFAERQQCLSPSQEAKFMPDDKGRNAHLCLFSKPANCSRSACAPCAGRRRDDVLPAPRWRSDGSPAVRRPRRRSAPATDGCRL